MLFFYSCSLLKKGNFLTSFIKNFSLTSNNFVKKSVVNFKFQKQLLKNKRSSYKKNITFFKYDRVVCKRSRWVYNSKNFRNILYLRNRVHQYFDGVFSNSFFKKEFENKSSFLDFIRYSFIKPEFRLDIILWRLNFFSSPYSARIAILKNQILVNGLPCKFSYFLKEGDIVELNSLINLKSLMSLKFIKFPLYPFIEIDYYTNSFVILQDFNQFNVQSFPCVIRQPFKASSLLTYLRTR